MCTSVCPLGWWRRWLQGKRLRFKPQDSSGNYYDICESETWTVPLEFSAMQGQSMLRKLKGGLAGQVSSRSTQSCTSSCSCHL